MMHYVKHDPFYETPLHASEGLGDLVDSDGHLLQGLFKQNICLNISYPIILKIKKVNKT